MYMWTETGNIEEIREREREREGVREGDSCKGCKVLLCFLLGDVGREKGRKKI